MGSEDLSPLPLPILPVQQRLAFARRWVGMPYLWGGASSVLSVDCSGFVHRVMERAGIIVPRDSGDQFLLAPWRSTRTELVRPGDLVFLSRGGEQGIYHTGIYTGNGMYIDSGRGGVEEEPLFRFYGLARYP